MKRRNRRPSDAERVETLRSLANQLLDQNGRYTDLLTKASDRLIEQSRENHQLRTEINRLRRGYYFGLLTSERLN